MNILERRDTRRGFGITALVLGIGASVGCTRHETQESNKVPQAGGAQYKAAPVNPLDPNKVEVVAVQKDGEHVQVYTVNQVDRPAFAKKLRTDLEINDGPGEGDHIRSFVALDHGQFVATPANIRAVAALVPVDRDLRVFDPDVAEPDHISNLTGKALEEAQLAHELATKQANLEMTPLRQHGVRMTEQAAYVITEYLQHQPMVQPSQTPVQMPDARLYVGQKPFKAPAAKRGFNLEHIRGQIAKARARFHQQAK
jgi:hypothetical protein